LSGGSASFTNAAQILRPPADGLPKLRGPQVPAQSLVPGGLTVRDGLIEALEPDPAGDLIIDASGCALVPGLIDCHTHLPFASRRVRREGPRRSLRGDLRLGRRDRGLGAGAARQPR